MKKLNPGALNKRITIQERSNAKDSSGEQLDTWTDYTSVCANVNIGSGRELFAAQKVNPELSGIIYIRYKKGIKPDMRIIYEKRVFDFIKPPINVEEKNALIEFHVRELV